MSANELNIGDYCYIKGISRDYGIGKITQLNSGYSSNGGELIDIQFKHSKHSVPKIEVISSQNIIDLIEVGDYVNGSKVIDISIIGKDKEKWVWVEQMEDTDNKYGDDYVGYNNEQIKSIVTKEQMEQMAYKVGE